MKTSDIIVTVDLKEEHDEGACTRRKKACRLLNDSENSMSGPVYFSSENPEMQLHVSGVRHLGWASILVSHRDNKNVKDIVTYSIEEREKVHSLRKDQWTLLILIA